MAIRTTRLALALLLAASLATPASATAQAPRFIEDEDKLTIENAFVRVSFLDKQPILTILPAAGTALGYDHHFMDVVEYRDLDGDGIPSSNEVVAMLGLQKADWQVTTAESDGALMLTLALEAPVRVGRLGGELPAAVANRTAQIALVFTIEDVGTTLDLDAGELTLPATSVRYDVVIESWPFVNAELNRLAIEMMTLGALDVTEEDVGAARVLANETEVGVLGWTLTATGNSTAGDVETPVRAAFANEPENATRLVFTYDAPALSGVKHTAAFGLPPTPAAIGAASDPDGKALDVPAPGLLVAAAGIGAAALALAANRRR